MKFVSQSLVGRVVGPSSRSSWLHFILHIIITCLEPLLNCQRRFKSTGVGVTLEKFFLGLGLTVTEINIKKVQKQDLKLTIKFILSAKLHTTMT